MIRTVQHSHNKKTATKTHWSIYLVSDWKHLKVWQHIFFGEAVGGQTPSDLTGLAIPNEMNTHILSAELTFYFQRSI